MRIGEKNKKNIPCRAVDNYLSGLGGCKHIKVHIFVYMVCCRFRRVWRGVRMTSIIIAP
jgi:hypothetical protein